MQKPLILILCFVMAACVPISTGRWYDSEKDRPGFFERRGKNAANQSTKSIKVGRGDNYHNLARKYGVPLRALIEANNARPPYLLQPGDRLVLPYQKFHIVRSGDTLYAISRKYNTDSASLARTNRLKAPYTLEVGQTLQISSRNTPKISTRTKRVKKRQNKTLPAPPRRAGRFLVPVRGRIISNYGAKRGGLHNDGINIAVPTGTPIKAAENGIIVYAGNELRGYGNLLLVRHSDGWVTAYAHLSQFAVRPGDRVKRGQVVAQAGQSGNVDSPQLHFEIRKGTQAVDPASLI